MHGDCHLDQLLVAPDGRAVVVDFERLAIGNPLADLGRLVADLEIVAARTPAAAQHIAVFTDELVSHYVQLGQPIDLGDLSFYVGCAHLDRALLPFRMLEPGWAESCRDIVKLGLAALDEPRALSGRQRRSFLATDAAPSTEGLCWETCYPRAHDLWPSVARDGNQMLTFGVYERSTDRFRAVEPAQDSDLPALAGWDTRGELIAYRPTRRATVRIDAPDGNRYVKIVRRNRIEQRLRVSRALATAAQDSAAAFPALPTVLEADETSWTIVFDEVAGRSLRSILETGAPKDTERALSDVAASLACFHQAPAEALDLPLAEPPDLGRWVGYVSEHDSTLARRCRRTLDTVSAGPSSELAALVHGDLHDGNVLLDRGRVGLIDLDTAARGDPMNDIGNLGAQLLLRAFQAGRGVEVARAHAHGFAQAYAAARGRAVSGAFSHAVAQTLFRLACVYRFRRRWLHLPLALLDEADHWAADPGAAGVQPPMARAPRPKHAVSLPRDGSRSPCVFVVGCPRSGTTLLQRMLDRHPELAVACDTHFIPRVLELVAPEQLEAGARGEDVPLTDKLVFGALGYHRFARLGLETSDVLAAAESSSTYAQFVSELYVSLGRLHDKPLAGEKTPNYVRWLPLLSGMFPHARFVHLIRDGRDVGLSSLEWATATKGPGKLDLWQREPVAVCALWWRWLVGEGRAAGRLLGESRYAEVSYESLVQNPDRELRTICAFLELRYAPEMLACRRDGGRPKQRLSARRADLSPTPGLRNWRLDMGGRDVALFEYLAGDLLAELAYDLSDMSGGANVAEIGREARAWWNRHQARARRVGSPESPSPTDGD